MAIKEKFSADKAVERDIFDLVMNCINNNCIYKCNLKSLGEHLVSCEFRNVVCNDCTEMYQLKNEMDHRSINCQMISINCVDCGVAMTKKYLYDVHKNINGVLDLLCGNWKGECPCLCGGGVQDNIKMHLKSCVNVIVECPMKEIGCTKRVTRIAMDEHVMADVSDHIFLLMEALNRCRGDNEDMKLQMSESNKNQNIEIDLLKQSCGDYSVLLINLSEKTNLCERKCNILEKDADGLRNHFKDGNEKSFPETYGEHTWTVGNILGKIKDAKKGIKVYLLSEPFYTTVHGYKMFLKIYPNGDGRSSGSNLSIYFVIAKGKYDNDIVWPFSQSISISLLTSRPGVSNRTVNMKPDTNANCYGKPMEPFNLAAGQPNFISHSELTTAGGYIENNSITVFAKVF